MIELYRGSVIFLLILKRSIIELAFVDILLFTIIGNLNYFLFIPISFKMIILFTLIQSTLIYQKHTKFIEPIFLIASGSIKTLVFLNFLNNNLLYFSISIFLFLMNFTSLLSILEIGFILNLLILISFFIKFIIPLYRINSLFLRKYVMIIIYLTSFSILGVIPYSNLNFIILLIVFIFSIQYFNRPFNINDTF